MENLFMNFFRTDMILTFLSSSNKGWKVLFSFFFWIKKFGFKYKYFKSDSQLSIVALPVRYVRSILIEFASITRSNAEGMGREGGRSKYNEINPVEFHFIRGDNSTRIFRVEFRIFTRQPRITVRGSINAKRRV